MSGSLAGEGDAPARADVEDDKDGFAAKRKQHYNEMDLVRKMMAARTAGLDDEDNETDEDRPPEADSRPNAEATPVVDGVGSGGWAFGPEDLHGGAKAGAPGRPMLASLPRNENPTEAAVPRRAGKAREVKGVCWDEATIAEHDLERGTRQKIEEPNTPWMGSPQLSNAASPAPGGTPAEHAEDSGGAGGGDASPKSTSLKEKDVHEKLSKWYRHESHRPSIQVRWDERGLAALEARISEECEPQRSETSAQPTELSFAEKRKQHYNEKAALAAARAAMAAEEEEEIDESDA